MNNQTQYYRNKLQLTQAELAVKSGLSLRTIQRIEAGYSPSGYTLKALSKALAISSDLLTGAETEPPDEAGTTEKLKLINISALSFIIIPFGNIIFPAILARQNKDDELRKNRRAILSLQILWSALTSLLLVAAIFIQYFLSSKVPLFILLLIIAFLVNTYIIIRNGIALNRTGALQIKLKNSFL